MSDIPKIPSGDDQFTGRDASNPDPEGPIGKGTAGQDAQNRRNKGVDEDDPFPKGTAGEDAQNRRNKGVDEA
ncbi:hypothetical protein DBR42_24115 [Pelomonas sp. HMWF004]|nr:hypothetical protein DBR42_24115 [Pelomonas sp. HMWF004]